MQSLAELKLIKLQQLRQLQDEVAAHRRAAAQLVWPTPGAMAKALDPSTVQTPALDVIDAALVELNAAQGQARMAIFMPPQEGKSTRASYWFPLWCLVQNPDLRIIIISYSDEMARRWGADIKMALETFNGDEDTINLGLRLREDTRAAGRWQVAGHKGGVYCAGIGGSVTGKPADLIIIDDPHKDLEDANSPTYRGRAFRFWQSVAIPRMAPNTKVCHIQTRWNEEDMAGQMLASEGKVDDGGKWRVVSIPAIADSPDDPLGRPIGEGMVSARGLRDWDAIRKDVGEYVFAALYQQRPAPMQGGLFKRLWWRYWTLAPQNNMTRPRIDLGGRVVLLGDCWRFATMDLAASTKTSADWTVASAWAHTPDGDLILLDRVRGKVGEAEHFDLVRPLVQRWQLDTVFVEASQYETTLVKDATRNGVPISPIQAEVDKFSRALSYSPRVSGGRVWLPAGQLQMTGEWVDEHASFPNGSHDDQVDTGSMAVAVTVRKWSPPPAAPHRPPDDDAGPDFLTMPL